MTGDRGPVFRCAGVLRHGSGPLLVRRGLLFGDRAGLSGLGGGLIRGRGPLFGHGDRLFCRRPLPRGDSGERSVSPFPDKWEIDMDEVR